MLGFCIFAFSIGLPVWPWLFHRTSFPSFPVPAEQGVQGTETKPQQWESQSCKSACRLSFLLQPQCLLQFPCLEHVKSCRVLGSWWWLETPLPEVCVGAAHLRYWNVKVKQVKLKKSFWSGVRDSLEQFSSLLHFRSHFSRSLKMPKAVETNCFGNGNSQVGIVYFQ